MHAYVYSDPICDNQHLAQNLISHERNYKALVAISDKVDSIMTRIESVETDVQKTLKDMEALLWDGEDNPILSQVKTLMLTRLEHIERQHCKTMHENMEPSAQFMRNKRKQRDTDDFLKAYTDFLGLT